MRKPLIVVCAVTSVALIAGGLVATTAGAGTDPDVTTLPGPAISSAVATYEPPSLDPSASLPPGPSAGPSVDPSATGAAGADPEQPATDPGATENPGPADPATPAHESDDQPEAPHQDAAEDPAAAHQPAAQDPAAAQQPVALSLDMAARQYVTSASVSTSPSAPVQQQILALINLNRHRAHCGDLSLDRRLILAAQAHAVDMAHRDYFAHNSANGTGPADRVTHSGYRWQRYGENIARGLRSPYEVVAGWMHSPEHRAIIMDCRLQQMGIGLAFGSDRNIYWVQDFATPL